MAGGRCSSTSFPRLLQSVSSATVYRFALRPRWLLSHAFALALVVIFVALGFWQLKRHDDRAARNETVVARSQLPMAPLDELLDSGLPPAELRYRKTAVEGRFLDGADLLVDNRSNEGLPGAWVITGLERDDGSVVAVNRGFQAFAEGEVVPPPPPSGTVTVAGTVQPFVERGCARRTDDTGRVVGTACLRRDAVEAAFGTEVVPLVVQRMTSDPPAEDPLIDVPHPELDDGPHRSYAVQWFIFATIGAVGYPLILRRVARDRAAEARAAGGAVAGEGDDAGTPPVDTSASRG